MVILRILGNLFMLLALFVLGIFLWVWLAGEDLTQQAGQLWYAIDSESLNLLQALTQRFLHPWLWDSLAVPMLLHPAWEAMLLLFVILLVLSGILLFVSRRRPRRSSFR